VQPIGADADLGAEAEFDAVGEARRRVGEDRRGIVQDRPSQREAIAK